MQLRSESLNPAEQVELITMAPNSTGVRNIINDLGKSFLKVSRFRLLSEVIETLFQGRAAETKIDINDDNKFDIPLLANQFSLDSTFHLYSRLKQIEQDGKKIYYDVKPHALVLIGEFKEHNDLLKQLSKTKVRSAFVLASNELFHYERFYEKSLLSLMQLSKKDLVSIFNDLQITPLSAKEPIRVIEKLDKYQIKIFENCTNLLEEKPDIPKKYKQAAKIQVNKDKKYNLRTDAIGNHILSFLSDRNKCSTIMNVNKTWRRFVRAQPVTGDYIPIVRDENDCYVFVNWKTNPVTTLADFHGHLLQLKEKDVNYLNDWIDPPDIHGQKQTINFNLCCASILFLAFGALFTYLGVTEDNNTRKLIYEIAASILLAAGLGSGCVCCGKTICCKKQGEKDVKNLQLFRQLTDRQKTVLDDINKVVVPSRQSNF